MSTINLKQIEAFAQLEKTTTALSLTQMEETYGGDVDAQCVTGTAGYATAGAIAGAAAGAEVAPAFGVAAPLVVGVGAAIGFLAGAAVGASESGCFEPEPQPQPVSQEPEIDGYSC
ncbi:hypothetical protein OCK74_12555 [Chitinophagaceae bacterium LB-8]|uniref:Bacteriocin n=1 Tax=Paraflavisolibacter caeni TaxID=2982496 RepID=A0A9X2XW07_9BACT|nr:hypothetical protein [Paraflavisolibacter caeni]MCU7549955.1 hypothetical protein [Paraflavisolibacter caeni]